MTDEQSSPSPSPVPVGLPRPSLIPALDSKETIKAGERNMNDVLLGRGPGLSKYAGNCLFRALVDERKHEYVSTSKRKEKKRIAKEILDLVHSKGGRFLKQDDENDNGTAWYEVDGDTAMEKVKQSLREQRHSTTPLSDTPEESALSDANSRESAEFGSEHTSLAAASPPSASYESETQVLEAQTSSHLPRNAPMNVSTRAHCFSSLPFATRFVLPEGVAPTPVQSKWPCAQPTSAASTSNGQPAISEANGTLPPCADARLLLYRGSSFGSASQQSFVVQSFLMHEAIRSHLSETSTRRDLLTEEDRMRLEILRGMLQCPTNHPASTESSNQRSAFEKVMPAFNSQNDHSCDVHRKAGDVTTCKATNRVKDGMEIDVESECEHTLSAKSFTLPESRGASSSRTSDRSIDDELSAFLLSSLALKDRPVITEEQEALERASLTDTEKAAILSDLFGSLQEQDVPRRKRARVDLDRTSIDFLVRQMKIELESFPQERKPALMEAQLRARGEEFSDERLEKFLRSVGMNTKLAAERFVNYWETRREVFGIEKFTMRMTLSEALMDDLVALSRGLLTILPHPDSSGRRITLIQPRRHTREGYSSESMLRAIWYVAEVAARENVDVGGGFVNLVWTKGSTLWEYDIKVFDRWAYLVSSCMPIKLIANHLCCPSTIDRIIKPIVHTFANKDFRSRTIEHNVTDNEIVTVLSKYGISREMLPSEMGGLVLLDQEEWIADRRAAELEAIN